MSRGHTKLFQHSITFRMVTVTMVGWQMGIMTLNRYLRSEVPSTLAA